MGAAAGRNQQTALSTANQQDRSKFHLNCGAQAMRRSFLRLRAACFAGQPAQRSSVYGWKKSQKMSAASSPARLLSPLG